MSQPLLTVRNLEISVRDKRGHEFKIVDDISFDVKPSEVIALIGESGSGKTTISLSCMGYTRSGCYITAGSVKLGDTDVLSQPLPKLQELRGKEITYVAQSAAASFNGAMTIDAQVTEIPVITGAMSRADALKTRRSALYRTRAAQSRNHRSTLSASGIGWPAATADGGNGDDQRPAPLDP